jgi:hypothetical protein
METMDRITLGQVIAKRELDYNDADHGARRIEVLLGLPVESPGGGEWYCPWQVLGIGNGQVRATYGVDAFQSLQLVMKMIGATLYARSDKGTRLSWMGNRQGDFGFPWE